jgi:hypothetical protein
MLKNLNIPFLTNEVLYFTEDNLYLKVQCHEMVVKKRP